MRISDWSSDVCSSDLTELQQVVVPMLVLLVMTLWFSATETRRVLLDILLKQISFENASWEDRLTGLGNRRRFDERLDQSWHQARKEERRVGKECARTCRSRWLRDH